MEILKSVAIFKETPEEDLSDILPHLEEMAVETGELISKRESWAMPCTLLWMAWCAFMMASAL